MAYEDYGIIIKCPCGWFGPMYLMLVPTRYPGFARCPDCRKEVNTEKQDGH